VDRPATLTEPSRRTPVRGEYDVVVVGGGPAGLMAAAAAARTGHSAILLERYGFLGGAGTAGTAGGLRLALGLCPHRPPARAGRHPGHLRRTTS
jgi:NADPH-dependent 2,4-dienoyl-CoA reductase/sulfur reductase-like enzyme